MTLFYIKFIFSVDNVKEDGLKRDNRGLKKGYYGVGVVNGKSEYNYWTLFRTACTLNADFLFTIGKRYKLHAADTVKSALRIPTYFYEDFDDFNNHRPYNCPLIGIEMDERSKSLHEFRHPKNAIYLLGAEDHGLSPDQMNNCQDLVCLPGEQSMNVSVAGSIVLHDRWVQFNSGE